MKRKHLSQRQLDEFEAAGMFDENDVIRVSETLSDPLVADILKEELFAVLEEERRRRSE